MKKKFIKELYYIVVNKLFKCFIFVNFFFYLRDKFGEKLLDNLLFCMEEYVNNFEDLVED